jgi:uncharacterized OB-fold protein
MSIDEEALERCPNCGRERSEWTENDGEGVVVAGIRYCSAECAQEDQARG